MLQPFPVRHSTTWMLQSLLQCLTITPMLQPLSQRLTIVPMLQSLSERCTTTSLPQQLLERFPTLPRCSSPSQCASLAALPSEPHHRLDIPPFA